MPIEVTCKVGNITSYRLETDRRILGIALYEIDARVLNSQDDYLPTGFWQKAIEGCWKLRRVHYRPELASYYYARREVAWLVRVFFWVEVQVYWRFLGVFYRLGLIDTKPYERFRWSDFYRIRR